MTKKRSTLKTIAAKKKIKLQRGHVDKNWVKKSFPLCRESNADQNGAPRITAKTGKRSLPAAGASRGRVTKKKRDTRNAPEQTRGRPPTPEIEPIVVDSDEVEDDPDNSRNVHVEVEVFDQQDEINHDPDAPSPQLDSSSAEQPGKSPVQPPPPQSEPIVVDSDEVENDQEKSRNTHMEVEDFDQQDEINHDPDAPSPQLDSSSAEQPGQSPVQPPPPQSEPIVVDSDEVENDQEKSRNAHMEVAPIVQGEGEHLLAEDRSTSAHTPEDEFIEVNVDEMNTNGELEDAEIGEIEVVDVSDDEHTNEVNRELAVRVQEPLAMVDDRYDAILLEQERFIADLQRRSERWLAQRQRNLAAIQGEQLRAIAAPGFYTGYANPNVTVVNLLEPTPEEVQAHPPVSVALVPLMSPAERKQAEFEDEQFAQEMAREAAAGARPHCRQPLQSPLDERACCTCLTRPAIVSVLGCGHMCLCGPCGEEMQARKYSLCPQCRKGLYDKEGQLLLQRLY
jgi:Zinc finger, C3HC4 type (RING finger)